ncbi:hypothetical protein [Paenibacillus terrae]|uniref:hypothetical protein n=1 Tax=Paenibacillus terrae TaxID=159743 RepID=UPI001BAEF725|nr:hypothetical protein [Paenibacillus terrae]
MKSQYLRYAQLPNEEFIKMYVANPVEALSVYFLETVDVHTFWEWRDAGGTYEKAIEYKRDHLLWKVTKKMITPLKYVGICTKVL